jgi:hypothetical protein
MAEFSAKTSHGQCLVRSANLFGNDTKEIQTVTPDGFGKVDIQVASYSGGFSPITTADKFKYKA